MKSSTYRNTAVGIEPLTSNAIHLWLADFNVADETRQQFWQTLASDERQRAERFAFERDRHHFIAGRGILRQILSEYLHLPPDALQFAYSPRGKPSLLNSSTSLCFNLSHSQGLSLVAIALDREVGVDLEGDRPIEALRLAKRFFSPQEYTALANLPPDRQPTVFFKLWTCKEAYLKATGTGLVDLTQVEIGVEAVERGRSLTLKGGDRTWLLQPLDLMLHGVTGFAAAVAVSTVLSSEGVSEEVEFRLRKWLPTS
jgi:4'-phosphopantetheinyl transferase